MKLTKTQLNYAESKLNRKINELQNKNAPEYVADSLETPNGIYDALVAMGVPMVSRDEFNKETCWYNYRDITKLIKFPEEFTNKAKAYNDACTANRVYYENLRESMLDKLYLAGDAQDALDLIESL